MSFSEKQYLVTDYYCNVYSLTAKELYERVLEDSKSDYNWIAPARELVRICKKPHFPVEYALPIKIAILNCFANLEQMANYGADRYRDNPEDQKAVHYCYNSLYGINTEEAISARKRFLNEIIFIASELHIFNPHYHPGATFRKLREEWSKSKLDEYISKKNIDFTQFPEVLYNSFIEAIKIAEANGDFDEDEKKDKENQKRLWQMIANL